jgi:hypothetical protein
LTAVNASFARELRRNPRAPLAAVTEPRGGATFHSSTGSNGPVNASRTRSTLQVTVA